MTVLGIDVSKARLDAALLRADGRRIYSRKAANTASGAWQLLTWACQKRQVSPADLRVVVEATGVYHETLAETLHDAGATVIVANPKRVRDYAQGIGLLTKTDPIDARALAYYGADPQVRRKLVPWQPPAPEIRTLRALMGRLAAVEQDLQRERNRLEKAESGAREAPAVVDSIKRSLNALKAECDRLKRAIDDHYDQHPGLREQRAQLKTIPAVGNRSADQMLCVLGARDFVSARQAAAFCGLVPRQHDSGTSVHRPSRLTKQGAPRLRAVLYMAAVAALRHNPELKRVYDRLLDRGKPKMSALGALMRKLVHLAYGILKHRTAYNPCLVTRGVAS